MEKLINKDTKRYVDAKVVILPSDEMSLLFMQEYKGKLTLFYNFPDRYNENSSKKQNQYMHILSDEKPLKGDLVYGS